VRQPPLEAASTGAPASTHRRFASQTRPPVQSSVTSQSVLHTSAAQRYGLQGVSVPVESIADRPSSEHELVRRSQLPALQCHPESQSASLAHRVLHAPAAASQT
jgi:hypothetical protein